jgi:hypothetical protein
VLYRDHPVTMCKVLVEYFAAISRLVYVQQNKVAVIVDVVDADRLMIFVSRHFCRQRCKQKLHFPLSDDPKSEV